jgi:P4 family phage/plasmid primase-like protien
VGGVSAEIDAIQRDIFPLAETLPENAAEFDATEAAEAPERDTTGEVRPLHAVPGPKEEPARTDLGNAQRFAEQHAGRLRYVRERRMWLSFDGTRLQRDATGDAERAAKETVRRLLLEAVAVEDDDQRKTAVKFAMQAQAEARLRAMLTLASTEPGIALGAEELDRDPWLLACPNCTVDLRTGIPRPHDSADLITMATDTAYDPAAGCPRWLTFLEEVFAGDAELIEFVTRFVGYCLTGDTREHVLIVLHGAGRNGKSTLVKILQRLLGDHAVTAALETFLRARGDRGPRNDLARLHRARLVTAAESGEGKRLDEATVKELTGGDRITARFLYAEHIQFVPQFKLVIVTNHRPKIQGDDEAVWARLRLVPFDVCFTGREDRTLDTKLDAEMRGILAWAVQGCLAWQKEGLGQAAAITRATGEYRQDEDVLGSFLAERCVPEGEIGSVALRTAYESFCEEIGEKPLAASVLGRKLKTKGITRGGAAKTYRGVSLR